MAMNNNEWQVFASLTEWHLITKDDSPLSSRRLRCHSMPYFLTQKKSAKNLLNIYKVYTFAPLKN